MGYYMGDYYSMSGRTSFYRGDPFWGFLGRLAKGAFSAISGFGHAAGPAPSRALTVGAPASRIATIGKMAGTAVGAVGSMISRHPVLSAAGAAAVMGIGAGAGGERLALHHPGMRGFHINKHGKTVRNRRMRATNPRALHRALRRAYAFERIAMRTIHLLHPKKKAHFGGFKRKRARRV